MKDVRCVVVSCSVKVNPEALITRSQHSSDKNQMSLIGRAMEDGWQTHAVCKEGSWLKACWIELAAQGKIPPRHNVIFPPPQAVDPQSSHGTQHSAGHGNGQSSLSPDLGFPMGYTRHPCFPRTDCLIMWISSRQHQISLRSLSLMTDTSTWKYSLIVTSSPNNSWYTLLVVCKIPPFSYIPTNHGNQPRGDQVHGSGRLHLARPRGRLDLAIPHLGMVSP